ncbi:MAG: family 16 glycosylhydrolase [Paludibacteraceae bacterium]|nr:family 16 glycosylhydrolase [Paludibacteraceae bacterium]
MKKVFYLLSLSIAVLCLCVSCEKPTEPTTATLTLSPVTVQMKVGEMVTIDATGTAKNIEWTSSDENVASVYYGVVTAKAIGMTVITARSGDVSAECQVYVTGTDGTTLRITPAVVSMKKGETYQFSYGNTFGLDLTWSSSDESIATVDQNGLVTAKKGGNATITLATSVGSVTALVAVEHTWGEYQLVWSDEFNGTALDESNWTIQTGGGGWGNQEAQHYTNRPENIRVEGGNLVIEGRKESYGGNEYTSARIYSKGKREFCYGKLEARISLPAGQGTWPAFWTLGNRGNWPNCGEIDIMEHTGSVPNRIFGTLHTTKDRSGSKSSRAYTGIQNIENNFHTYGIEWTQEEKSGKDVIRFYVDDIVYSEQVEEIIDDDDYWPFNRPNYFIINLALGGTLGGNINDAIFDSPLLMKVDWVRVYQRNEVE